MKALGKGFQHQFTSKDMLYMLGESSNLSRATIPCVEEYYPLFSCCDWSFPAQSPKSCLFENSILSLDVTWRTVNMSILRSRDGLFNG
jgi:hypothetical protein